MPFLAQCGSFADFHVFFNSVLGFFYEASVVPVFSDNVCNRAIVVTFIMLTVIKGINTFTRVIIKRFNPQKQKFLQKLQFS